MEGVVRQSELEVIVRKPKSKAFMIVLVMRKNQEVKGFVMQSTARKDTDNCTKFHIIHFNANETHATVGIKEA